MNRGTEISLAEELKALAILLEAVSNESFGDGQYDFFSTSDLPADVIEWRNERLSPALNSAVTRCRAMASDILDSATKGQEAQHG